MKTNWLYKIQQHEAAPPEGAWKNIANMLDENSNDTGSFAARLTTFETPAPAAAQKNVFALLDEEEKKLPFEKRIYSYEIAAPESAWPQIVNALDKIETKIIPLETRNKKLNPFFLRAAAAIAVIAVFSISAWFLSRQPSKETATAATEKKLQPPGISNNNSTTQKTNTAEPLQKSKSTVAIKPSAADISIADGLPELAYVQHNQTITLADNPATARAEKLQNSNGDTPQDVMLLNNNAANSYVTITGPDGQSVRLSSKLSAFINYLNDNTETQENIEIIIKESAKWRATFAAWREKMTNNSIAPSLTNFMDIIELSSVLEEKD